MFFLGLYDTTVGGRCDLLGVEHTVGWGGSARGAASSHWWFRVRTTARRWRGRFLGRGPRRHCLIPQVGCSTVYFWSKGADIWLPGIYFSSLPRSRTRNHRTRIHFLSYSPLLRANNLHIAQVPVERHTSQRSWVSDTIAIHHKWLSTSLNGASSQHCAINSAGLGATVE